MHGFIECIIIFFSYLIRDIRQSESSSWKSEMLGATLLEADQFCDLCKTQYSEKLKPVIN